MNNILLSKPPFGVLGRWRNVVSIAALAVTVLALSVSTSNAADRIFDLVVMNLTDEPVSFKIIGGSCWEGTPREGVLGPIAPRKYNHIQIARIQGNGCNGKNGFFSLVPTNPRYGNQRQDFTFDNDGNLTLSNVPNSFNGELGVKDPKTQAYHWYLKDKPKVVDPQLSTPRNAIATDAGTWGNRSQVQKFLFLNSPGLSGNYYDHCAGVELFHPQHIVRLPNKNGRAYFMVSQSRAHNGWISVLETNPGVLNPTTDALMSKGDNVPVGKYIWQDLYRWKDQVPNPVGNWNHPGKMDLLGGVLVVAAQNWAEHAPCFYGAGESIDKVLFYDVRDPQHPKYWGAIDEDQLSVNEISTVGLVRTPNGDYLLTAGGDGRYTTWCSRQVSPQFENWKRVPNGSPTFSGQHGMNFNSYQKVTTVNGSRVAKGAERIMYFDSHDRNRFSFNDVLGSPSKVETMGSLSYPISLPGADRDWDADSIYVSPVTGQTIVYTVKSEKGENGEIYQVVNP